MKPAFAARKTSEVAKQRLLSRRGEPLFLANWDSTVFIHYETDPAKLQACVPYEIDLHHGRAYVSVVAFTMRRMRPRFAQAIGEYLFKPVTDSCFLNVRTYVRRDGEPGIYFMSEWLSNRLSVLLGPWSFGLPYRYGQLDYEFDRNRRELGGRVAAQEGALSYRASWADDNFEICQPGSLNDFLLERYTAYTKHRWRKRFFRIWHEPWLQVPLDIDVRHDALIESTGAWWKSARCIGGNYSPGVEVWMGWPHRVPL